MKFCYELDFGCCGGPVRSTVCTALCHYMFQGILVTIFAFTNYYEPPIYHVDYLFGGCGAVLFFISFITALLVDSKKFQSLRVLFTCLTILTVCGHVASSIYYVVIRKNDISVTALVKWYRGNVNTELPDPLWLGLSILIVIDGPLFIIYLIYIMSFMCNSWKSFLFTSPYQNNRDVSPLMPHISVPGDKYSSKNYKPYPVQQFGGSGS